jgi:hypothetical protein
MIYFRTDTEETGSNRYIREQVISCQIRQMAPHCPVYELALQHGYDDCCMLDGMLLVSLSLYLSLSRKLSASAWRAASHHGDVFRSVNSGLDRVRRLALSHIQLPELHHMKNPNRFLIQPSVLYI